MERYGIVIPAEGDAILLRCWPGEGFSLKEMQDMVEGPIEVVPAALNEGWAREPDNVSVVLVINEEGKLQNLPVNEDATDLTTLLYDQIVGNAILLLARGEELIGLKREAAENIMRKWGLVKEDRK